MNRKFHHLVILVITKALLTSLTALFIFGFINLMYHLAFNNPVITYGGW
jgi:hypothetical protein